MSDTSVQLKQRPADEAPEPAMIADHVPLAPDAWAPREPTAGDPAAGLARLSPAEIELTLSGDLAEMAAPWRAFEQHADRTFFQTHAWLAAWQAHVGSRIGAHPAIVAGRHPDGTLLFILPLAVQPSRGVRQLTFLGSDLCDYNAPLLDPAFGSLLDAASFPALWARIVTALRADRRFAFDTVNLPKMPERVGGQANPLLALGTKPNPSGAYLTALSGSWDEFYARKRSSATRRKEKKQLRQLGEFGEIRFVDALDGTARAETLDVLFEQKARSFARMGVRNIFKRPGYRELFTAFALDPANRHLVHLSRLDVGGVTAAASIGFTACNCYYLVLSSYLDGDIARLGPGRTHLQELLRYALRNAFGCFDFTIGDELYKQDWSDARVTLHDHLSAVTLRGAIAVGLITRFRTTKRAIKQNPVLWKQFSRARSALGAMRARRRGTASPAGGEAAPAAEHSPRDGGESDA